MRYIAIVHTWNGGSIDYFSVCDNKKIMSVHIDGALAPPWLQERAAMLRLCEINRSAKGEAIGRKFSDNMIYVYLNKKEHRHLSNLTTGAEDEKGINQ